MVGFKNRFGGYFKVIRGNINRVLLLFPHILKGVDVQIDIIMEKHGIINHAKPISFFKKAGFE